MINELKAALPKMSPADRATAQDMINRAAKFENRLTERQEAFAAVLIRRAQPSPSSKPAGQPLDLTKLTAMFDKAGEKLKRPKIQFLTEAGEWFAVSKAGAESRNPGYLYVKGEGNRYLGKIDRTGNFMGANGTDADAAVQAQAALITFCKDPAAAAKAFGDATANCCFCSLGLTDDRSVTAGYGPICAKNYGLAWG